MELQEIEAIIERDGTVRLHVRGVKGTSCLDLTRAVEAALGNEVVAREMTPEALDETRAQTERREDVERRPGS
jgi:hypothetical protein